MVRPFLAALLVLAAATVAQTSPRIHTDRPTGKQLLKLPKEEDAFGFVVFGDRTGGPVAGIEVLAQAVEDTNLLDPDLVFTVGDLINGYNGQKAWMQQAAEFKTTMKELAMPWFPVAGNHDIYWRGAGKPAGEHEKNYEAEFGPLWYAVQHKKCWFIALYTDEGNPETGEKNFSKPECQRMSPEQFAWLEKTLAKARRAPHVFVFLHHPRWLARYGEDWDRVHALLAKNGNVSAVFAGHIHRMRFDGVVDGIEYYTVASVGADLAMEVPQAGFLHQFHVVTVRPKGISVAALPVGTVLDPKLITGDLSDDILALRRVKPTLKSCVGAGGGAPVLGSGTVDALVTLSYDNPSSRPIELEIVPLADPSWRFGPDHQHLVVPPKQSATTTFAVQRPGKPGEPFGMPQIETRCDYLAADRRIGLPRRQHSLDLPPPADLADLAAPHEGVLTLDGNGACLGIPSNGLAIPDGALTLEAWLCGDSFTGRRGLLAKSQQSDYCLFCSDGKPSFSVFLGKAYANAESKTAVLKPGQWHHVAGVYDQKAEEVRLYLDGVLLDRQPASGKRKTNDHPLYVGADPDGNGRPMSFFDGKIDEVRVSKAARYRGDTFEPPKRHRPDADTVLLLHLDTDFGPWTPDSSGRAAHPRRRGSAHCTVESRPNLR